MVRFRFLVLFLWALVCVIDWCTPAHAGVSNGQPVSAAVTNAAFVDKNTVTTFTIALTDIQGGIELKAVQDSTSTGSNQNVTLSGPITVFTNGSLASIQNLTFTNRSDATMAWIRNKTGGTLTLVNLSGGTAALQIDTGIGANLALKDGATVPLYYNTVASKWQVTTMLGSDINASNITNGTLAIGNGGTGQTGQTAAFDALSPLTTGGDLLTYGSGHNIRLGTSPGDLGKILKSGGGVVGNSWSSTVPQLGFDGASSGSVTVKAQAAAGTWEFDLPITAGTAGMVLTSQGGAGTAMTWSSALTNPMTTTGDIIYSADNSGTPARLAIGSSGNILKVSGGIPAWGSPASAFTAPTNTSLLSTGTQTGSVFTISTSSTVAAGDQYTNNGHTYTVVPGGALSAQSGQVLWMTGTGATSGTTLTRSVGAGTATITFSTTTPFATYTPPVGVLYLYVTVSGGGGGGGASTSPSGGSAGGTTWFGPNMVSCTGGALGSNQGALGIANAGSCTLTSVSGLNLTGGQGGSTSSGALVGVVGGANPLGGGGAQGATSSGNGGNGAPNTGAGGGGSGANGATNTGGGGGASGGYAKVMVSGVNLLSSFPYIIGGGGNGQTGTRTGGNGANGIVYVEEFYQ